LIERWKEERTKETKKELIKKERRKLITVDMRSETLATCALIVRKALMYGLNLLRFCCPVWVEALRWADLLSKDFYQLSIRFLISEVNSELEQTRGWNP
jgi:hypothetical protein